MLDISIVFSGNLYSLTNDRPSKIEIWITILADMIHCNIFWHISCYNSWLGSTLSITYQNKTMEPILSQNGGMNFVSGWHIESISSRLVDGKKSTGGLSIHTNKKQKVFCRSWVGCLICIPALLEGL